MKKFTFLVAALCATMMASAATATFTPAAWGNAGVSSSPYQEISKTVGDVTLKIDSGFCNGSQIRAYTNAKVMFTSENNITKIEFTTQAGDKGTDKYSASALSGTGYTAEKAATSGVWIGSAKSVTLTTSAQCRMTQIIVTTDGTGSDAGTVDTLSVSVAEALTTINALADNGVAADYYILSGVVSNLDLNTTDYGNASFTLTDASGSILVWRAYNIDNKKFTDAAQLANGDSVKVLGQLQKYVKDATTTPELVKGYLVDRKATGEGGEEGGEGGEEGGEGELDYSFEPTEVTTIDETMSKADWTDYTIDGLVLVGLGNEQYEVSLAVLTTKAAMPVGTFEINDSEAENTVLASPGGDETYDYPSFVAADFEGDVYNAAYYLVSGNVTISVAEDVYTIKLDAKSYNGSTIKMAYTGAVEEYTAIRTVEIDNTVYARDGRIYAEEGARIYSLTGLDVTRMNGNLEGIYIVKNGNKVAKVAVAK